MKHITAIPVQDNPTGTIAALLVLSKAQRIANESEIEVFAFQALNALHEDAVVITCKHLSGENAGANSVRAVIIPNQPESMPTQPVRFMEFDHEYELRQYAPIQVGSIALDAVYFLINGDLPDLAD